MSRPIPVQNLYYLLSYAWSDKLQARDLEDVTDDSCPDLANFFAKILGNGVHQLIRRGLDRDYITQRELTPQLRGRIDFSASAKRQTWNQGKMVCSYDDLSHNVLHNQILHSTLRLLCNAPELTRENKNNLKEHLEYFRDVSRVRVTPRIFRRIQLHRNNRSYQFLLHLCELIHASLLPEHQQGNRRQFRRIEENEAVMPYIFESFILNFAKRHFPSATTGRPHIQWLAEFTTPDTQTLLPRMETDVTIDWPDRKLIVECKYYKQAFAARQYSDSDDPKGAKFKTQNLYQIFAYLMNKRQQNGWQNVEGMLIYPTTTQDFHHDLDLAGNRLQVSSINLNQPWSLIESDLINLLKNLKFKASSTTP